jgi:ribulose-5-phosphate 4-epimerase/fuculose-1-phosphate aldolase
MKRPLAYITASWGADDIENTEDAAQYCRKVYDAGFTPICPILFLPLFLNDPIPQEHKDGIDMARDLLRRAHVLVVCGKTVDEAMKNDIAIAERLRITATTLEGILTVKGQGRDENMRKGRK